MQILTFLDPSGTTRGRIGALPGPVPPLEGRVVAILNNMPRTEDTEYSERATMERITDETFARFVAAMTSPRGAGSAEAR